MAGNTGIEWTDRTWSPIMGCTKVSPGCDHCYAERLAKGRLKRLYPDGFDHITLRPDHLHDPWGWKKPQKIFVCSMSDLFHPRVPFLYILRAFVVMAGAPQHTFQVLTKRPGRMAHFANVLLPQYSQGTIPWPSNVWAGTSVESAKYLPRLDVLARVPAKVRFVSAEPLLGSVDLRPWLTKVCPFCRKSTGWCACDIGEMADDQGYLDEVPDDQFVEGEGVDYDAAFARFSHDNADLPPVLSWVIVGGESGPGARPMHPQWARDIRDQCQEAGVPFFFKQSGEWAPEWLHISGPPLHRWDPDEPGVLRVGKKAAGALLDGREWKEMPNP